MQKLAVDTRDDGGEGKLREAESEDDDSLHCGVATVDVPKSGCPYYSMWLHEIP